MTNVTSAKLKYIEKIACKKPKLIAMADMAGNRLCLTCPNCPKSIPAVSRKFHHVFHRASSNVRPFLPATEVISST